MVIGQWVWQSYWWNSISPPSIDSVEFFLLAKSTETKNVILRALADMIGDPWTPPSAIFMLMLVPNIPDLIGLEPPITPVEEESIFKNL